MSAFDSGPRSSSKASADTGGPFSAPVNSLLRASFDQDLDGLEVDHQPDLARGMNAKAYTVGSKISLGAGISDDVTDEASMEVISHEVAHALAGGGSGKKLLDEGRHDAGETGAHAASGAFRQFIAGGARGPAPKLQPAHGGEATVHRFEAGEHADAVDNAEATLKAAGKGGQINAEAAKASQRMITLGNGVKVSQGEITAMMGDFYGAYTKGADGKEHFNPMASFDAMDNADPKEMEALVAKIRKEKESVDSAKTKGTKFEHTENADFESITNDRRLKTDENGTTTGLSYMDLAQKNSNHFNQKDESGTDNNMGAYTAFHSQAMKAAQSAAALPPGPEREKAEQRALALEASSQHFLTDRFAGGHQFDKAQMVAENGGGKIANLRARTIHDQLNENGAMVENADGERWRALGDSHWADEANAENRVHTAQTTLNSYGDITDIMSGKKTEADFAKDKAGTAHKTAPKFDDAENKRLQAHAKDLSVPGMLADNTEEVGLLPTMGETWGKQNILHPVVDGATAAWNKTKSMAGSAWDWTKGKANEVADGAGKAWDATKQGASDAWDWTKQGASDTWDATKQGASDAWDSTKQGASDAWDSTKQGASDAWSWGEQQGSQLQDWGAHRADDIAEGAGQAWDATKQGASDFAEGASQTWDATKQGAGQTWDATKQGASDVADSAGQAWDETKRRSLELIGL